MDKNNKIVGAAIYPSIGIARVGNSQSEYFLGPEAPGETVAPPGGFKDKNGHIKRQAARFRIYGINSSGQAVQELHCGNSDITWTVHVANRKADWYQFFNRFDKRQAQLGDPVDPEGPRRKFLRNSDISDRASLVIDPGSRSISGRNVAGAPFRFDSGRFGSTAVALGEIRTDPSGRLIFLGGHGKSASVKPRNPITDTSFNNNDWYDDTSDGPVTATVVFNGKPLEVTPAWVVVAPPNFAPQIDNITTLYDVMRIAAVKGGLQEPDDGRVSFARDVFPFLRSVCLLNWTNAQAQRGHGPGASGDFMGEDLFDQLKDNSDSSKRVRQRVFNQLRNPDLDFDSEEAKKQANYQFMPRLSGDGGSGVNGDARTWFRIPSETYARLKRWADGDFESDWDGQSPLALPSYVPLSEIEVAEQPAALTRAALEPCVGGSFHPGIEITYIAEDPKLYGAPFSIDQKFEPGDVTKWMALPWQADFFSCTEEWWPAQRPFSVVPEAEYQQLIEDEPWPKENEKGLSGLPPTGNPGGNPEAPPADPGERAAARLAYRTEWGRGVVGYRPSFYLMKYIAETQLEPMPVAQNAFVDLWPGMAFVVGRPTPDGETVFVESEREKGLGIDIRDLYYRFANIDENLDYIPKAEWLADHYLKLAWESQDEESFPDSWRYFRYSKEAFNARLQEIYEEILHEVEDYQPAADPIFRTREDVIERVVQMAPFNQNDGAWIHKIAPSGPLDEVVVLLFSIWMDEAGDGTVAKGHSNVYTEALHSLGIYFPDVHSYAYAQDPRFMDSAFTVPALELAIGMFPNRYFPELLGFTLMLEWTVNLLRPMYELTEYYNINSNFYRLHIGIDNAAGGHGAKAKQAIELYLDRIARQGGDEAVQAAFKRIWNGFICFGVTGDLGEDVRHRVQAPPSSLDKVLDIIKVKAPFASMNHGTAKLADNYINDWFSDPGGFVTALVDNGFFVPNDVDNSKFFRLTSFDGPMFKVFSDEQMQAWKDWVHDGCPTPTPSSELKGLLPPIDFAQAMCATIDTLRGRQAGVLGHTTHLLKGPSPENPAKEVEKSVSWWFAQPNGTLSFMKALSNPANGWIVPGEPGKSPFLTNLLSEQDAMGRVFAEVASGARGLTHREVAEQWIQRGCSVPDEPERRKLPHTLESIGRAPNTWPPARVHGMGGVH